MQSEAVDAHHGRVFVLVLDERGDGAHADAHGTDEHKGVELLPLPADLRTGEDNGMELAL